MLCFWSKREGIWLTRTLSIPSMKISTLSTPFSQLLQQRGVVTRRAAAAAGLKVEDQVREEKVLLASFFSLSKSENAHSFLLCVLCLQGGWEGDAVEPEGGGSWQRERRENKRLSFSLSSSKSLARQLISKEPFAPLFRSNAPPWLTKHVDRYSCETNEGKPAAF